MGLRETGRALDLIILLALLQNLLAEEPSSSPNETLSLVTVISPAMVELVGTEGNLTHRMEVEFGPCTVTCGIGMREVILTSGCPGDERKCIVRIEECKGPPDCGWGKPVSETIESVKIPCIFVSPENRFQYVWKMLIPGQQSLVIPNDSAILEVHRDTHPTAFECDTMEDEELVASVKYTVYTMEELETRRNHNSGTNVTLVFVLITGIIVCICVIFGIVFLIINWTAVKIFWQTKVCKSRDDSSSGFRSSSGMTPMGDASQASQAGSFHKQVSYQEWNEPPEGGGGGEAGAKGGETTDGEKGNY